AVVAKLLHLIFHELGEFMERYRIEPDFVPRLRERLVEFVQLVLLPHDIRKRRDTQNPVLHLLRLVGSRTRRASKRTRTSFLAGADAFIPQLDERRPSRLQRLEAETIAVILDEAAIVPF